MSYFCLSVPLTLPSTLDPVDDAEVPDDGVDLIDPTEATESATKVTTRYLTKYERARILGTRALQIRCVSPPLPLLVFPSFTAFTCCAPLSLKHTRCSSFLPLPPQSRRCDHG